MRIGYYDLEAGQGTAEQADVITALGQNAFLRTNLQAADTQRAGVLFIQNGNPVAYTAEFIAAAPNLVSYVNDGGVAIFHDVAVAAASATLAGFGIAGAQVTIGAGSGVDFTGTVTPVTTGKAGLLDDNSLDGAVTSAGYVGLDSVQDQEVAFLATRTDAAQGLTLLISVGSGYAIYSTIDLETFLADFTPIQAAFETYAGNLVRYGARLADADRVVLDDSGVAYATTDAGQDVFGGDGNDELSANHKRSMLHGGAGNDGLDLSGHADLAWGGTGDDQLFGSHADDQLWGGADNDTLKGGAGEDFLVGGSGTDFMAGGNNDDRLFGGDGNDTIHGGFGRDYFDGGAGADRFMFGSDVILGPPPGPPPTTPLGGPVVNGVGMAADYVAHFDVAGGDIIDLRAFGPIAFRGAAFQGVIPEFIIQDNVTPIDVVMLDLNGDGNVDFEINVENAGASLTSADIDWLPYPT